MGAVIAGGGALRGLTFELTPRAEAGTVSRDGDDGSAGAGPAYSVCRSESGVERVVRRRRSFVLRCCGKLAHAWLSESLCPKALRQVTANARRTRCALDSARSLAQGRTGTI